MPQLSSYTICCLEGGLSQMHTRNFGTCHCENSFFVLFPLLNARLPCAGKIGVNVTFSLAHSSSPKGCLVSTAMATLEQINKSSNFHGQREIDTRIKSQRGHSLHLQLIGSRCYEEPFAKLCRT